MKHWKAGTAALAVVVPLALAGCTGTGGSQDSPAASSSGGSTELSGTVTYWHAYSEDSQEVATLQDVIIPAFEKANPGVTVDAVTVPYDELHQKLITAAAGEQLPDLVRADIGWVPELANLGVLEPLSTSMSDFQDYADQVYPGALATNLWKGTYYGLPLDTNTRVMMYNADALTKAGVEVPTTIDELVADAPALKAAGSYAFADNGASGWNVLPWIWSYGGSITDDDVTVASGHINSDASIAAVQMLVDMYQAGYIPSIIVGDSGGVATSDGLVSGDYATILDGPWMFPIYQSQYPDFELHTAQMPAGDGGSVSVVGGEDIVMTSSAQNKEASMAFLRYLLSADAQLAMAKTGQMPVLSSLTDQLTAINDYFAPFVEQLATAKPRPVTPAWNEINTILQDEIQSAMRGEVSVKDALDSVATQADALLAEYR